LIRARPAILVAVALLAACGPAKSTTALIKAHFAIKHAEAVGAQANHPYELTLAKEYFVKGKEAAGYSHFQLAETLAGQSIDFARIAAGEAVATPTPAIEEEALPK
jgi:hypothetical protein